MLGKPVGPSPFCMHPKHKKVLPRWCLGAGVVDGHEERPPVRGSSPTERGGNTDKSQAAARQERGSCSTDLSRPSGPSLPFPEQNHPPKLWCAVGKAGTRLQSSACGQLLCKALTPPVSQAKRHFNTPRSLLCSHLQKSQAKGHLAGCQHQHGHVGEPMSICQRSPLNRAQLQLKLQV